MPEVYDPTGGTGLRSRRRRKRKASVIGGRNASALPCQPVRKLVSILKNGASKIQKSAKGDPLDFDANGNTGEDVVGKTVLDKRGNTEGILGNGDSAITRTDHVNEKRATSFSSFPNNRSVPIQDYASAAISTDPKFPDPTTRTHSWQYAIGIDTRFLDTSEGREEYSDFRRGLNHFLSSTFLRRGLSASSIAWTESHSCDQTPSSTRRNKRVRGLRSPTKRSPANGRVRILSESLNEANLESIVSSKVQGTPIRPPINHSNTKNRGAVHIPKGFMANATWGLFGDLVQTTMDGAANQEGPPLKFVIFTSNASTLLDSNEASHRRGMDTFWDKVQEHNKRKRTIYSIEIVVVKGDAVVAHTFHKGGGDGKETSNDTSKDNGEEDPGGSEHELSPNLKTNPSDDSVHSTNESSKADEGDITDANSNLTRIMARYMEAKAEADFKANRSLIQFDPKFAEGYACVKIRLSMIDSATGFSSLCQKWARDRMQERATMQRVSSSPTISFLLPETVDFDACELSFSSNYKTMPFRLDSPQAKQLSVDLELLGNRSKLEVVQLVPISSIDASLIYGIPIGLKASLEDNEEEQHEKSLLIQSLFKTLAVKDSAILIRSIGDPGIQQKGLFHSPEETQYFLFLPEFFLSKEGPVSPKSGVLYRMVSVDHILEETTANDLLGASLPPEASMVDNPFSEFVESSLDSLPCFPWNPWLHDVRQRKNNQLSTSTPNKSVGWDDTTLSNCNEVGQTIATNKKESNLSTKISADEDRVCFTSSNSVWNDDSGVGSLVKKYKFVNPEDTRDKEEPPVGSEEGATPENEAATTLSKKILQESNHGEKKDRKQKTQPSLNPPQKKEDSAAGQKMTAKDNTGFPSNWSLSDSDSLEYSSDNDSSCSSSDNMFGKFHYGTSQ